MIHWSGYGFIVCIVVFLNSLLAEVISENITGDNEFYQKNLFPLGCSFLVSAFMIKLLSLYFDRRKRSSNKTHIIDKMVGNKNGDRLFFIRFYYWAYIMGISGIGIILYQVLR